jgi:hypothetical protein
MPKTGADAIPQHGSRGLGGVYAASDGGQELEPVGEAGNYRTTQWREEAL